MAKVRPEDISVEIMSQLERYSDEVAEEIKEEVQETASECLKEIKANSPTDTGEYKRGWKKKVVFESDNDIRISKFFIGISIINHICLITIFH